MTKAIILSGGWGTRLRPLTCSLPKTLIPVVNVPVVERQITLLRSIGVKEIVLAVSVMSEYLKGYFGDGSSLGIKIHYTNEENPMGTAGALKLAEYYLRDDNFFLLNGDEIINFNFKEMLEFHENVNATVTIASKTVEDTSRYGVLIVNGETNRIDRFLEKEEYNPPKDMIVPMPVNAGVYIFEPEVFDQIAPKKKLSIERDVFPILAREGCLYNYSLKGMWKDIGTPLDLLEGNILLMKSLIEETAGKEENIIATSVQFEGNTTIIPPITIGEHVIVRYGCKLGPNAVIGDNSYLEKNAMIKNSIINNKVFIGENSIVEKAIVADNCRLEENVELKGNENALVILGSSVHVLKNIRLISPKDQHITYCHHEVVRRSID
ncbi:MAG: NDP-sugar synthase [Candidatus Lokiarchaeota archaeon]|nr:NDP-sugar synthase [Candidatus Lokiarchaeota archaeon]